MCDRGPPTTCYVTGRNLFLQDFSTNVMSLKYADAKFIVFSDWDGTITVQDSNDYMTDHLGFGKEKRQVINDKILDGSTSFRDGFHEMLESIKTPFPECIEFLLKNVQLDPGFADFYKWAHANNIPVVVVSSGMVPIIRALLVKLVGQAAAEEIDIIANDVVIKDDGSWHIKYRDESSFGHDKSRAIRPYAQLKDKATLFYCGDGVSDLSAARETDLLFAKEGRDLIKYCQREGVPYTVFKSFKDIHTRVQAIVEGKATIATTKDD